MLLRVGDSDEDLPDLPPGLSEPSAWLTRRAVLAIPLRGATANTPKFLVSPCGGMYAPGRGAHFCFFLQKLHEIEARRVSKLFFWFISRNVDLNSFDDISHNATSSDRTLVLRILLTEADLPLGSSIAIRRRAEDPCNHHHSTEWRNFGAWMRACRKLDVCTSVAEPSFVRSLTDRWLYCDSTGMVRSLQSTGAVSRRSNCPSLTKGRQPIPFLHRP